MQIVQDLVAKKVDGIAVVAIQCCGHSGSAAGRQGRRHSRSYLGLRRPARQQGPARRLYRHAQLRDRRQPRQDSPWQIKPKGGTVCIQSGGAAAANHNERMQGIRDALSGKKSAASPGDRLTGQNGWTEIDGCPLYTNDDFPVSVQQFTDIMAKNPNLDAFIPTGGFPQFIPDANRAAVAPYKDKIASKAACPCRRRHAAGADRPDEGRPVARPGRPASVRNGLQDDDGARSDMKSASRRRPIRLTPVLTSARPRPSTPVSASNSVQWRLRGGRQFPLRNSCRIIKQCDALRRERTE